MRSKAWHRCRRPTTAGHMLITFLPLLACMQADLLAMRKSLGDKVAYFERDGSANVDNVPPLTIELPDTMATIDAAAPWG